MMRLLAVVLVAATAGLSCTAGWAQDYPARPVKIIVPFAVGGPADVYARFLGARLQECLKAADELATRGLSITVANARFAMMMELITVPRM